MENKINLHNGMEQSTVDFCQDFQLIAVAKLNIPKLAESR